MARNWTTLNTQGFSSGLAAPGSTGTVALWINPNWTGSSDTSNRGIWMWGTNDRIQMLKDFNKNVLIGYVPGGGAQDISVAATGLFTSGTWGHHCLTWNTATPLQTYYVGGVSKGTRSLSITAVTASGITLGNEYSGIAGNTWANAILAEFCIWSVDLTVAEVVTLASGVMPWRVRPASILGYWPVWGLQSPEPDLSGAGNSLTLTGSAKANHAPVTLFTGKAGTPPDIAAAATFVGDEEGVTYSVVHRW